MVRYGCCGKFVSDEHALLYDIILDYVVEVGEEYQGPGEGLDEWVIPGSWIDLDEYTHDPRSDRVDEWSSVHPTWVE